jgi:hypothetical protein
MLYLQARQPVRIPRSNSIPEEEAMCASLPIVVCREAGRATDSFALMGSSDPFSAD